MRKYAIIFLTLGLFLAGKTLAAPSISNVSGTIGDGQSVSIGGSGFGTKSQAAPFRSSYDNPNSVMNFQESGIFGGGWGVSGPSVIKLQNDFKRLTNRYYVRMEYSANGNWGTEGYGAGVQTNLPMTKVDYWAWWDYLEPDFDASHMLTGSANFKYIYAAPGRSFHDALQVSGGGTEIDGSGNILGDTTAEQKAYLDCPHFSCYFYSILMWRARYSLPKGEWYFVEVMYKLNSQYGVYDGWIELKVNNQRIYRADKVDFYDSELENGLDFEYLRLGGNYGFDSSGEVMYRYYGDIYIDGTLARIYIGDSQDYSACKHLELQVPKTWTNNSISFTFNQGSFNSGDTAYLFVVDKDGNASGGKQITIGGGSSGGDIIAPSVPSGLTVK